MKNISTKKIAMVLVSILVMWLWLGCVIQAFKCQKMTQTELLLNIGNSLRGNFKDCN